MLTQSRIQNRRAAHCEANLIHVHSNFSFYVPYFNSSVSLCWEWMPGTFNWDLTIIFASHASLCRDWMLDAFSMHIMQLWSNYMSPIFIFHPSVSAEIKYLYIMPCASNYIFRHACLFLLRINVPILFYFSVSAETKCTDDAFIWL